jgi:hypothetical protein
MVGKCGGRSANMLFRMQLYRDLARSAGRPLVKIEYGVWDEKAILLVSKEKQNYSRN